MAQDRATASAAGRDEANLARAGRRNADERVRLHADRATKAIPMRRNWWRCGMLAFFDGISWHSKCDTLPPLRLMREEPNKRAGTRNGGFFGPASSNRR